MAFGIEINEHTLNWIAKEFNGGLKPKIQRRKTVYVVHEDKPNEIITLTQFYKNADIRVLRTRKPRN